MEYVEYFAPLDSHESLDQFIKKEFIIDDEKLANRESQFLVMPLMLANGEVLGVLLIEPTILLSTFDLRLIDDVLTLIAIALESKNIEDSGEIVKVQVEIEDLKNERELRDKFLETLVHDLRSPLTSVKMSAQLILRGPENVEKNQQLSVKIIRNIDRMDSMIRDF